MPYSSQDVVLDRECDPVFDPLMQLAVMRQNNVHTFEKPWGRYTDYFRSKSCVFKTIEVDPGHRLSLQTHAKRDEVWYVISGSGIVTVGYETKHLVTGRRVEICRGQQHRLENTGEVFLIVAEMQCGDCDEDDIERLEDDYKRA